MGYFILQNFLTNFESITQEHKVAIKAITVLRSCLEVNMSSEMPESAVYVQTNDRTLCSNRGLNQHLRSCKQNPTTDKSGTTSERNEDIETSSKT